MSLMVSFGVVFFPQGVMDEIWDLIESVSEGSPTYFCSRYHDGIRNTKQCSDLGSNLDNIFVTLLVIYLHVNVQFSSHARG